MKWSEENLILAIRPIAKLCATGLISWDTKERAIDDVLKLAGWTRGELKEMNRRREAHNN